MGEVEDERNHQRQSYSCIYMVMFVRDRLPLTVSAIVRGSSRKVGRCTWEDAGGPSHYVISGWRKGAGLGRGFTEIARFHVYAINHSPLISAVLFFPPQLPLDRRYSAWKRSPILRRAHAYLAIAFACCHGYRYTNSFIVHAHVVRKCSARTVSKRVHVSFQLRRVDRATRRATVGFLEDSGRNGKKGTAHYKYCSPVYNGYTSFFRSWRIAVEVSEVLLLVSMYSIAYSVSPQIHSSRTA